MAAKRQHRHAVTAASTATGGMRRLLGHRDARIYLGGQVVSLFGDSCLWLAMGIWVKR
jgi:hypothetical protein